MKYLFLLLLPIMAFAHPPATVLIDGVSYVPETAVEPPVPVEPPKPPIPVEPKPPVPVEPKPPVPQTCGTPSLTAATNREWTQVFRDAWPQPVSAQKRLYIPTRGYYSVSFNTGNVSDAGFFTNIEASGTIGYRLGAVSECPGDFNVQDECQYKWGGNGGIFWSTNDRAGYCQLKANTTYYWNLTFTDGINPDSSRCVGSYCETYFQVSNR